MKPLLPGQAALARIDGKVALVACEERGVIPDGPGRLVHDEALDRKVASTLLAGLVGLVALAAFAGLGQQALVRPMQSDKLATIASAGLPITE